MNLIYDYPMRIYSGNRAAGNIPHELYFSNCKSPIIIVESKKYNRKKIMKLFNQSETLPVSIVELDLAEPNPFKQEELDEIIAAFEADSLIVYGDGKLYSLVLKRLYDRLTEVKRTIKVLWLIQKAGNFNTTLNIIDLVQKHIAANVVECKTILIDDQFIKMNDYDYKLILQLTYDLTTSLLKEENANFISRSFAESALGCAATSFDQKPSKRKILVFQGYYLAYSAIASCGIKIELMSDFDNGISIEHLQEMIQNRCERTLYQPKQFEFCQTVRTICGQNALEQIPVELKKLGASRPMILATPSILKRNFLDLFIKEFPEDMSVGVIESNVPQDSDFKRVIELADSYRQNQCDSIIVVGGGSYLDTAKGINILVSENSNDLAKFDGSYVFTKPLKPLIAVPTTSGTGSEVTLVSVIANQEKGQKHCFISPMLLPNVAILDPRMTMTLPASLTAATGMDALTHAIESYYSLGANPVSAKLAWNAINLIYNNLEAGVKDPTNAEVRLKLAIASNLAGVAFSNSMVSMVHTIGHVTGAATHISHGNCMAILLPYGLEYNLHKRTKQIGELLYAIKPDSPISDPEEAALAFIQEIRDLNDRLREASGGKHPTCFSEVLDKEGNPMMKQSQIPEIAVASQNDGSIVYNPEQLSIYEAQKVLEAAWTGEPLDRNIIKKGHQK